MAQQHTYEIRQRADLNPIDRMSPLITYAVFIDEAFHSGWRTFDKAADCMNDLKALDAFAPGTTSLIMEPTMRLLKGE